MTPDTSSDRSSERSQDSRPAPSQSPGPGKNTRREARELALRMLFQLDLGKQPVDEVVEAALGQSQLEGLNRQYAEDLVRGTLAELPTLDARITALTPDWTPDRQAAVDRSLLRLAAWELLFRPDAPVAAVVNEAVELAKKYSTADSGRFVNGVLGALARQPRGPELPASQTPGAEQSPGRAGDADV